MISNWRRVELSPGASLPGNLRLYQNVIYHGNPMHPEIGDVRVWFEMAGRTELGHQDKVKLSLNNWGETERAPHKWYSCARMIYFILWYVRHAKLYTQHGSMSINVKYSIAHSHAWATGHMYAILI